MEPIDEKLLEKFPKYEGDGKFVGTREYWMGVFQNEKNRNPELHEAFAKLHDKLVNEVIQFCKENGLDNIDEVHFHADGLIESVKEGKWEAWTDSSMSLVDVTKDDTTGWMLPDRQHPFLFRA